MSHEIFCLVGLGNHDKEYKNTRHNVGYMFLDFIAEQKSLSFKKQLDTEYTYFTHEESKIFCVKPALYMNNSGIALSKFIHFYKINTKNIIVVHDDVDLEFGKIKIKIGGGSGGHNGIKSIDSHLDKNYCRLRIGIGRNNRENFNTSSYVLSKFLESELKTLNDIFNNLYRSKYFYKFILNNLDIENKSLLLNNITHNRLLSN